MFAAQTHLGLTFQYMAVTGLSNGNKVKNGFPHTRQSTPRIEEHLASGTKGCEGKKCSGE